MTVISNTSPLNYLVLIELQQLLPDLFDRVLVPEAVLRELRSPAAPAPIRAWLDTSPDWLESRVIILGVIDMAARRGLVNRTDALERLGRTSFRASPRLLRAHRRDEP